MIVNTLLSCFRAMSYRMFPIFPQLQVALPSIQHSPFAIMNQREETRRQSFTEWLSDNYIMWAAPKKRTSIQKRRQRRAAKNLEVKTNIVVCPKCGKFKLLHHLCNSCMLHKRYTGETREY